MNAASAYSFRKLELDDAVFRRSNKALASALQGGKHLTREALRTVLKRARIAGDDLLRFNHMLIRAELDRTDLQRAEARANNLPTPYLMSESLRQKHYHAMKPWRN